MIAHKFSHRRCDDQVRLVMINEEVLRGLAGKLAGAVPQNLKTAGEDIERNFRQVLRSGLGKMDLVSREEFDVQAAVLARTRQKLEQLEQDIATLTESLEE
ncbi:MAG: accessory factor UbiK family protein [Woeseiaceae bacterium]